MKNCLIIILLTSMLVACTHQPTSEERAQAFLDSARTLYSTNNLEAAKPLLDSVHQTFPQLVNYRRQADTLAWHIELKEIERNLAYIDSLLPLKIAEVNTLNAPFAYEKNEKFQDQGTFTYKMLRNEWNLNRNYAKPYTNENGEMFIAAHYCGKPLAYSKLRLSSEGIFAESANADNADRHAFTDLDVTHEVVLFGPEALGTLPDFWTTNTGKKVKITFVGERHDYTYTLTNDELNAFVATYQLATTLADTKKLQELQRRSLARQNTLVKKIGKI